MKIEHQHPSGFLKSLMIPKWKWEHITIWPFRMALYDTLYGKKCRSSLHWDEVIEQKLLGLEILQQTSDIINKIKQNLKVAQDRHKSYLNNRQKRFDV